MKVIVCNGYAGSTCKMITILPGVTLHIWPKSVSVQIYWLIWTVTIEF